MHLTEGTLRSYFDQELRSAEREQVAAHLDACSECRRKGEALRIQGETVGRRMAVLSPHPGEARQSATSARSRLNMRIAYKKEETMWEKITSRNYRPAFIVAVLLLVLSIALLIPSVRAAAINFLGLFRVQQVTVVEVNPANLPEQLGSSVGFEQILAENVQVEEFGESQEVSSSDDASRLAGFSIRLPAIESAETKYWVQAGTRVTFSTDLDRFQAILEEMGREDVQLPESLGDAEIVLNVQPSVATGFGACEMQRSEEGADENLPTREADCMVLVQMPSPTVSAPPGLDIAGIGQALLQVMGLSPEEAKQFSETVDWATTLVIPIPRYGAEYRDVEVDGVRGTLIEQSFEQHAPNYMIIWVNNGMLYVLTAQGDPQIGLEVANSLK